MYPEKITLEVLKARAAMAGVQFQEAHLTDLANTCEQTLAPLRTLYSSKTMPDLMWIEPAVSFHAAHSEAS
ncbi:MAG: hypothetical protein Kow00121_67240 [Elainellaceae cyanobacterium]